MVAQNFQAGYEDLVGNFADDTAPDFVQPEVGSYMTYDLQVAFNGIRNLTPSIGVKNVLDKDPPYSNVGARNYFQGGYDAGYADPRGRFVYASVRYDFK
jgi:iron complex outermembrane receptor protein